MDPFSLIIICKYDLSSERTMMSGVAPRGKELEHAMQNEICCGMWLDLGWVSQEDQFSLLHFFVLFLFNVKLPLAP